MNLLFVCTQNVFRSLSAEKLLQLYLRKKQKSSIQVFSAGTEAYPDHPYSFTLKRLKELGVENLEHHQTKVSKELLEKQDIVICMTKKHQEIIRQFFGKESFLFNELAFAKKSDLADDVENNVYGESLEVFVINTVNKINQGIPTIYEKILLKCFNNKKDEKN